MDDSAQDTCLPASPALNTARARLVNCVLFVTLAFYRLAVHVFQLFLVIFVWKGMAARAVDGLVQKECSVVIRCVES